MSIIGGYAGLYIKKNDSVFLDTDYLEMVWSYWANKNILRNALFVSSAQMTAEKRTQSTHLHLSKYLANTKVAKAN